MYYLKSTNLIPTNQSKQLQVYFHAMICWVITVLSLAEVTSTLTMKAAYFSEALLPKYHITVS